MSRKAYDRFKENVQKARRRLQRGFQFYKQFDFVKDNAYWLKDYAMFMSLKSHFNNESMGVNGKGILSSESQRQWKDMRTNFLMI